MKLEAGKTYTARAGEILSNLDRDHSIAYLAAVAGGASEEQAKAIADVLKGIVG